MRVVICTRARLLGAALADALRDCGDEIVAITTSAPSAMGVIRRARPDVLVADSWVEADLPLDEIDLPVVLLCDDGRRIPLSVFGSTPTIVPRSAAMPAIIAAIHGHVAARPTAPVTGGRRSRLVATRAGGHFAQFLSARERDVLGELVLGADTATLAARLQISRWTARDHVQSMLTKLNAHTRLELVSIAIRDGLVDPMTGAWLGAAG